MSRMGCMPRFRNHHLTFPQSAGERAVRHAANSGSVKARGRASTSGAPCLARDGMLHMIFKLSQCAEQNWRKLRGFDYLAKVIIGVKFKDEIETKPDQIAA